MNRLQTHHIYLFLSLLCISFLFYLKWQDQIPSYKIQLPEYKRINYEKGDFLFSSSPISNALFYEFVKATHYLTWRERHAVYPTWQQQTEDASSVSWLEAPNAPALWLTQDDAFHFCFWLNELFPYKQIELPSVTELELEDIQQTLSASRWLWTRENYSHFDTELKGSQEYLTAWHPKKEVLHRREKDFAQTDIPPVSFHIIWNRARLSQ